jgi:hypothetical protein
MTFVMFGEGRRLPALGAANAHSTMINPKVGRVEFTRGDDVEIVRKNVIATIQPGETAANKNPGGGGYGDPFDRPVDKVTWDVKNQLVSIKGAREDYGVVIADTETLEVDTAATAALRGSRPGLQSSQKSMQNSVQKPVSLPTQQTTNHVSERAAEIAPAPVSSVKINYREPESEIAATISKPVTGDKHRHKDESTSRPLTGADVGFIKIIDFDKQKSADRKHKKSMKIRYF